MKAIVYKNKNMKNEKDSHECKFNIINKWVCKDYIPSACSIEIGDGNNNNIELYAEENGSPVTVTYIIKSELNGNFSGCGCEEWKIDISGNPRSVGCNKASEFSKHEIVKTVDLLPNNKANPKYELSGRLITTRKLLLRIILFITRII